MLAIDARGFGETRFRDDESGDDFPVYFGQYDSTMTALLRARRSSACGCWMCGAALICWRRARMLIAGEFYGFGKEGGAAPLLYAAAMDERISKVALEGMLVSYQTIIDQRIHRQVFEDVVPGVLRSYDLPDLVSALAPRPVWIVNGVNALGQRVTWPR